MQRIYRGILVELEDGLIQPGQRLVETALSVRYRGGNAVRGAMQKLAACGVMKLSTNLSPAIRRLDAEEALRVLEVAEPMTVLLPRCAARRLDAAHRETALDLVEQMLRGSVIEDVLGQFSRASEPLIAPCST